MNNVPELEHGSGSWVIRNKTTGEAIMETFQRSVAEKVNFGKYEVVTILQHLVSLNN